MSVFGFMRNKNQYAQPQAAPTQYTPAAPDNSVNTLAAQNNVPYYARTGGTTTTPTIGGVQQAANATQGAVNGYLGGTVPIDAVQRQINNGLGVQNAYLGVQPAPSYNTGTIAQAQTRSNNNQAAVAAFQRGQISILQLQQIINGTATLDQFVGTSVPGPNVATTSVNVANSNQQALQDFQNGKISIADYQRAANGGQEAINRDMGISQGPVGGTVAPTSVLQDATPALIAAPEAIAPTAPIANTQTTAARTPQISAADKQKQVEIDTLAMRYRMAGMSSTAAMAKAQNDWAVKNGGNPTPVPPAAASSPSDRSSYIEAVNKFGANPAPVLPAAAQYNADAANQNAASNATTAAATAGTLPGNGQTDTSTPAEVVARIEQQKADLEQMMAGRPIPDTVGNPEDLAKQLAAMQAAMDAGNTRAEFEASQATQEAEFSARRIQNQVAQFNFQGITPQETMILSQFNPNDPASRTAAANTLFKLRLPAAIATYKKRGLAEPAAIAMAQRDIRAQLGL